MLNILVAPRANSANSENIAKRIVHFLKSEKVEYSVFFHNNNIELSNTAKTLSETGETNFVMIGDDITLSMILNSVKDISKIKLGIISSGNHNDFAKFMGLDCSPIHAIRNVLGNKITAVDYLKVNDMVAVNNLIIGASTHALEIFDSYKFKNFLTKKYALSKYSKKFEGIELSIESKSNKTKKELIFELSINNGGLSEGKLISPLSNVKDGLFNMQYVTFSTASLQKQYLSKASKGEHIYEDGVHQLWLDSVKLTPAEDTKIKTIVDGNIRDFDTITVSVVEGGLNIFVADED